MRGTPQVWFSLQEEGQDSVASAKCVKKILQIVGSSISPRLEKGVEFLQIKILFWVQIKANKTIYNVDEFVVKRGDVLLETTYKLDFIYLGSFLKKSTYMRRSHVTKSTNV